MKKLLKKYDMNLYVLDKNNLNFLKTSDKEIVIREVKYNEYDIHKKVIELSKANKRQKNVIKKIKDKSVLIVAMHEDKVVGYGFFSTRVKDDFYRLKDCYYLNTVFVDPDYRGRNINSNMVSYAVKNVLNKDWNIYSSVLTNNIPPNKVMNKLGFKLIKTHSFYRCFRITLNKLNLPLKEVN